MTITAKTSRASGHDDGNEVVVLGVSRVLLVEEGTDTGSEVVTDTVVRSGAVTVSGERPLSIDGTRSSGSAPQATTQSIATTVHPRTDPS